MTESSKSTIDALFETSIPGASLESILCTEELHCRPNRAPDHEKENRALVALAIALADSRQTILQTLAETILQVTESDSSGVSLLTTDDGGERFRWPAIAGMWKPHIGGGTPRDFGPCGDVLDRNCTLLFRHFERRYTYFLPITPLIEECLLVPFYVGGKAVGTIWAIMHSDRRKFDLEDERLMSVLGQFASLAYQALVSIEDLKVQMGAREKAEAAVRELANGLETQVRVRTQDLERSTRDLLATNEALEREVAERKRADEALQVRELNLRLLVDSIPAPVAVMTSSGEVETVNKPVLEYFGKTLEDLKKWGTSDAVHPDDLRHAIEIWMEAIRTGQPYDVQERLRRFDGAYRWFEVRGFPLRSPDGRILNWCVLLTDIDDRQRAEEALRRNEAHLSQAQRLAHVGSWVWQVTGRKAVYLSEEWYRVYGFDPTIGMPTWEERLQRVHPEDRAKWQAAIDRAIDEKSDYDLEFRILPPDTAVRYIHSVGHPVFGSSGELVQFVGVSMDVTETKQAEQAFRLLVVGTAATTGSDFFHSLVQHMAQALGARYAFATTCNDQKHARTLAFWNGDGFGENFEFDIADTPCKKVLHGEVCHYRQGLQGLFPLDKILADWQAESYLGVPMLDRSNRVIGHIAILDEKPMEADSRAVDLLKIFASRAAAELKRQKAEDELQAALQEGERMRKELRDVIEMIPTSAWTTMADGSVEFVNRRWREYTGLSGEESSGSGWQAAVHPEDIGRHVDKWSTSLATGELFENEVRYRCTADGKYRWFLARAVPLRDEQGNILKWYGISTDIEDRKRAEGMLAGEKRILEKVARGDSLPQILESLCRLVEEQDQDVLASVSLVDGNRLRHGAAPNLPKTYRNVMDGIVIGPCAGSCGTAAFRGEQVIVSDIATDPLWADYRDAALPHSLRACWSTPVFSSEGNVIATFAMYYREPRSPSARHKEIIEQISHLAGVAIQRTLAEEKLQRSEAYSAEAQRLSHTGSWHWNVNTGEVAWSQEYCAIFGFDFEKDKPSYQLFIERVHPEDRPNVERVLFEDVREKRDFDGEYRLLLPDGSIKYLHSLGKCSLDQSGDVEYIGAVVDITEHKRAEQKLRDSEERHRVVVEAASDAVISMDENGAILLANAAALRVFGYNPTELIGKPLTLLMPEYMRKLHENGFKSYLASGERHINWQGAELTGLRKNGQVFPVEISFGELLKDGRRIFTGFIRDISERKRAEEALRRSESYLAEAQRLTHIGSWAGNILTREIFHSSDEHSRLYGLDPESGIPSFEDLYKRVHPEDRVGLVKTFERSSHDRIDVNVCYRIVLPDGTTKHVEAVGHPVLKPSDETGEFIGFLMDVTERKRAEEERERLRQAQADLAHINRVSTMGELAVSLAHEIKQPIAAATIDAKTCLRWLGRDEPHVGEAREAASRLLKDVGRASDIIGRIGSLFKKNVPNRELVDVNDVIQEMIALLRGEAVRHSISIHGDLASDLPKTMADRIQLQQVLMNLMLNGIEAMRDMGTPGELTIKSEQDENRRIIVAISDTGVGLRPDQTEQVFNAFFTSKPQGTGMGLSISRSIVESHGGRLWASPNSGLGATFQFTLPIEVAAHQAA